MESGLNVGWIVFFYFNMIEIQGGLRPDDGELQPTSKSCFMCMDFSISGYKVLVLCKL